jgi:hypothetical protein
MRRQEVTLDRRKRGGIEPLILEWLRQLPKMLMSINLDHGKSVHANADEQQEIRETLLIGGLNG